MHFFTSKKVKHRLEFSSLSQCKECSLLAAKWAESEWGYIRNKGIDFRQKILLRIQDYLYIGFYAREPVAMFALIPNHFAKEIIASQAYPLNVFELMYVFVDKRFRGLGFGKCIVDHAKELARANNADVISFDTLKPSLNRFYEIQGAKMIGQGNLYSEPTDMFYISI